MSESKVAHADVGSLSFCVSNKQVFSCKNPHVKVLSMRDDVSANKFCSVFVPASCIKQDGDVLRVSLDPERTYSASRLVSVDVSGKKNYDRFAMTGQEVSGLYEKSLHRQRSAEPDVEVDEPAGFVKSDADTTTKDATNAQTQVAVRPLPVVVPESVPDDMPDLNAGRIYGVNHAQNTALPQDVSDKTEKKNSSVLRKVAVGAGIAGLVGVGASVYAGHKGHEAVEHFSGEIANAVGKAIMANASPIDRALPIVGAPKPSREAKAEGLDFDF